MFLAFHQKHRGVDNRTTYSKAGFGAPNLVVNEIYDIPQVKPYLTSVVMANNQKLILIQHV